MDVNAIIAFEEGDLGPEAVVELFSDLIRSGAAWQLQGFYGRYASNLIDQGFIDPNGTVDWDNVEAALEGRAF